MNFNNNSSGIYDVNAFNLTAKNATIITSLNISGLTTLNNATVISSLNVSGNTILNNSTTINSPLYISTIQNTLSPNALNVNASTVGPMVNLIQNTPYVNNLNPALNVSGYSNFGGVQINGQDSNNIYKLSGDLSLVSPSTNNILLKTNFGNWETMRINPYGVTVNTKLNVSSTTTLNNDVTCISNLNVLGNVIFNNAFTCSSSLNVTGRTIIGSDINNYSDSVVEMYKNFNIRKNVLNLIGSGERVDLRVGNGTTNSYFSMEEGNDIKLYNPIGNITLNSYNTAGNTISLLAPQVNVSKNLMVAGSISANNLSTQKPFTFTCSSVCTIGGKTFYRYDIDLTKYTKYITNGVGGTLRKFKWMSWLSSGAHNSGQYSLNYDIDYAYAQNLSPISLNGFNVLAYGFPTNYNLNQVTPNGVFLWAYNFNFISCISFKAGSNFQAIIIDYLV